jgi:hypothetical protein
VNMIIKLQALKGKNFISYVITVNSTRHPLTENSDCLKFTGKAFHHIHYLMPRVWYYNNSLILPSGF